MDRNRTRRIVTILLTLTVFFGLSVSFASAGSYTTKNYDVQMDVLENNSFEMKETIKVVFTEPSHGIYRYIPYGGETMRLVDGKQVEEKYRMKIKDVKVEGYNFETYTENGNLVIKIGDPDVTLEGEQEYRISYRCVLYDDKNNTFDSVYYNIVPTRWMSPIEASSLTIHMPKQFDPEKAELISGSYGMADMKSVDWTVNDTTIMAKTNRVLNTGEGITLNMFLPEGYFIGEKTTTWMLWLMFLLIIAAPVMSILLWVFFGRDPKVVRTVEFYPPEGVNSAELGYIIDGFIDNKDIVSLIIYWANKGFLTIREDEKNQFTLIKQKELSGDSKTYEYTMFSGLFANGDQVSLEDLKGDFYGTFEATKSQLKAHFTGKKENRVFTHSSIGARTLGVFLMLVPFFAIAILGTGYSMLNSDSMLVLIPILFFALIGFSVMIFAYDKKESHSKTKNFALNLLGGVFSGIASLEVILFSHFALDNALLGIWASLAAFVSLAFTIRMKQRTKKSSQLLGKILGFKEFIRTAELDRIKLLAEETPNYFYHVLPYAYVFGLTDKWAKKFEDIAVEPPEWYSGGYGGSMFNTWVFLNSFQHYTHALQSNIAVPPASSGGGGGSFSGGGGFSGGGMGGGGGGSW